MTADQRTFQVPKQHVVGLLKQGWFLALIVEAYPDDVPEEVLFEARAMRAMTEEYVVGDPMPPLEQTP